MNTSKDFEIPSGLSELGRQAAQAILDLVLRDEPEASGGCRSFYSPDEWKERSEEYGCNSELIVVYDGGSLAKYFNWDYECDSCAEEMMAILRKLGIYSEQCTCWYSGIYKI